MSCDCRGCGERNPDNDEWCKVCRLLVPIVTGESTSSISRSSVIEEIRKSIGEAGTAPRQIWSAIRSSHNPEEISWIRRENQPPTTLDLGIPINLWKLEEEDFKLLDTNLRDSRPSQQSHYDRSQLRRLQKGGYLPDGSFLSYGSGRWTLDGRWIQFPYRGVSKLLRRKKGMEGVDWRSLLYSIDWAVRNTASYYPWEGYENNENRIVHPVYDRMFPRRSDDRGTFRGVVQRSLNRILGASVPDEGDVSRTPWMKRWKEEQEGSTATPPRRYQLVPVSLDIHRGRLRLRVRRDSGWRWIEVDSHPDSWAKILNWALSPTNHPDREKLNCMQQFIFASPDLPLISGPDRRGISLLNETLRSTDQAEIDHESRSISVTGQSGLSYSIKPGYGRNHFQRTRFTVTPLGIPASSIHRGHPAFRDSGICIVETPELRRLVIGDAISSVVLALLNDLVSQRQIDTLRAHISRFSPDAIARVDPDTEHMREAQWLNRRVNRNPINARIRRYTILFPRLWGVLLRSPLGARVSLRAMSPNWPNLTFDDSNTSFSTTCMADRQIVKSMLEASGWIRDREEESVRGVRQIFLRTGTGNRDLGPEVEEFCGSIEPVLTRGTIQMIEAPLWHYFERENPGPGALLPGTDQRIS